MSLLSIIQTVTDELGLPRPSSIIDSTDATVRQLKSLVLREGSLLSARYPWAQLVKEASLTLVDGQDSYSLPIDFDRQIPSTSWDNTNFWQLAGPLTPQEWQEKDKGLVSPEIRRKFRIKGATNRQFFIFPTPTSSDAGQIITYEYLSKNWIKPRDWASFETFNAGSFCYYNGNIYYSTSGGVAGSTAPTHLTGDASDGGITWTYQDVLYGDFAADTDECVIDESIIEMGIKWRFLQSKKLDYTIQLQEYNQFVSLRVAAFSGASPLSLQLGGKKSPQCFNVASRGFGA